MMEDYNKYSFDSDYARESRGLTLNSYVSGRSSGCSPDCWSRS